jgi:hypothetical protein
MKKIISLLIVFLFIGVYAYSQVPQPPTLISPPSGTGACPPVVLDWNDVPTATSYNLQISFNSNFSALALDQNTDSSKYTIPNGILSGNTTYYWRVKASNQYGTSLWSSVWSVIPVSQPVAPLMYPVNGGNPVYPDSSTVFYWRHTNFATSYRIQVYNGANLIINQIVPDTFYIASPGTFNYNSTYYYRLAALNCAQTPGPWTAMWMFTTVPLVVINISSEIPTEYKLYSNYPNPFNPTTSIRYDIPRSGNVLLRVFDALGREVETLVNEKQTSGTFEATWNASQFPSGVYFYKLVTDGFSETKRMLMIK